jgi:signal transduction histidine kinase
LFLCLYDELLERKVSSEIELTDVTTRWKGALYAVSVYQAPDGSAYVHAGLWLFRVRLDRGALTAVLVDDRVSDVTVCNESGSWELAYLHKAGYSMFVSIIDSTSIVAATTLVPYATYSRLRRVRDVIAVISELDKTSGSVVTLIDRTTLSIRSRTLAVPSPRIALADYQGQVVVAAVTTRSGLSELVVLSASQPFEQLPQGEIVSGDYGSPQQITVRHDTAYIAFTGGMAVMTLGGSVLSRDSYVFGADVSNITPLHDGNTVLVTSGRQTSVFHLKYQSLWFFVRGYDWLLRYVLPLLFIGSLAFVWILNRRQRRLLDALVDSPATGLVFTIDSSGKLLRVNERAAALLRIMPNVPMGRHVRAYMQQRGLEPLVQYLSSMNQSRVEPNTKIAIQSGEDVREYIFTTTPLIGLFGGSRGAIVTGIDITETLEQRRLVNWAQLAHDMQTNLSTIRLNAEQLPNEQQDVIGERRRRILFQVGVLIDRVRDLLSIGRTDDIQRTPVHSAELCTEIRHEFDTEMFPHVSFSMRLRGTMMNVDRMKISRAVRNAVENAIKALRGNEGTVEIATWHDRLHVFISVSDTGIGMDPETMSNMMKPYFSTAQDGSGHGIGTMIMHHVMKLHGGAIRVTSEPGKGTQVIFRIPHEMDPKDVVRMSSSEALS